MKRCKKCGAFEGTSDECFTIEATGPVFGKHAWQQLTESGNQGAPGPEYWAQQMNQRPAPSQPAPTPRTPPNYLTADSGPSRGPLLDSRQPQRSNPLYGQRPLPNKPLTTADVRQAMGMNRTGRGWHATIIQECAPICRALRALEPKRDKKLPSDVRSRGPRV